MTAEQKKSFALRVFEELVALAEKPTSNIRTSLLAEKMNATTQQQKHILSDVCKLFINAGYLRLVSKKNTYLVITKLGWEKYKSYKQVA